MKTLLVVTYVAFWEKNAGHCVRISSMLDYLMREVKITVFFAGHIRNTNISNSDILKKIEFRYINTDEEITYKIVNDEFKKFIEGRFFHFALIEYVDLTSTIQFLPAETITFLDTHDLVHNKIITFQERGVFYGGMELTKEEELEIFDYYDYIILIQKNDFNEISQVISPQRLFLAPHPVTIRRKELKDGMHHVGYIASLYGPNIDAMRWFLNDIWPGIYQKYKPTLHIYGNINVAFSSSDISNGSGVIFHGYVDDLEDIYNQLDVIVNPVKCGAGLKIKNVEALGFGVPLITTTHGSLGIEDGISKAFLIADTIDEFNLAFEQINQFQIRKQLSSAAFELVCENFSEDKCYLSILSAIKNSH